MPNRLTPAWHHALDDYPTALAVSRDGAVLAGGTAAGSVVLLDASSGEVLQALRDAHPGGVLALAFGRKALASGGQDGRARLWDVRAGTPLAEPLDAGGAWAQHLLWTPDGKRLATAAGRSLRLWNETGAPLARWPLKAGINGLGCNPVGGLIAAAAGTEVVLVRAADGGTDCTLKWASTLLNLAWSPDGRIVTCGSLDKTVHFWRAGAWTDSQMAGYLTKPMQLAWSADSKQLATTGDECVVVWSFAGKGPEGAPPVQLFGHAAPPTVLGAHPKKGLLLSGAKDGRVLLWEPRGGAQPLGVAKLDGEVSALVFNGNASLAYGCEAGGRLQTWWVEAAG